MYNIIQDRIKFALRNVLINKSRRVKTVERLLVGGMKCRGIKCPGLTVAGRSVAIPTSYVLGQVSSRPSVTYTWPSTCINDLDSKIAIVYTRDTLIS